MSTESAIISKPIISIVSGGMHSFCQTEKGEIYGWGSNHKQQLEMPEVSEKIIQINCGVAHNIALTESFKIISWGGGVSTVFQIPSITQRVAHVAAGVHNSAAVTEEGEIIVWGLRNEILTEVPTEPIFTKVSLSSSHGLALTKHGTIVTWGDNSREQCNIPEKAVKSDGSQLKIVDISVGDAHSLALTSEGELIAWGDNTYGQCNIPEETISVKKISAGLNHNIALRDDGAIVAWGNNEYGQCDIPKNVQNVKDIAAGGFHTVVLTKKSEIFAWGNDSLGQTDVPATIVTEEEIGEDSETFENDPAWMVNKKDCPSFFGIGDASENDTEDLEEINEHLGEALQNAKKQSLDLEIMTGLHDHDDAVNLTEEYIMQYVMGKKTNYAKLEKQLSPKALHDIEIAAKIFEHKTNPSEGKSNKSVALPEEKYLKEENIFAAVARFVEHIEFKDEEIVGEKQTQLYCIHLIREAVKLLSEGKFEETTKIAQKLKAAAKDETMEDEAHNILAYIAAVQNKPHVASKIMSKALEGGYTAGLVHNALIISHDMPADESTDYILGIINKSSSKEQKMAALLGLAERTISPEEGSNLEISKPILEEMEKFLLTEDLTPEETVKLLTILNYIGGEQKISEHSFKTQLKQKGSIEVELFYALKDTKIDAITEFFEKNSHRILKSRWAKERATEHVMGFLKFANSLSENNDKKDSPSIVAASMAAIMMMKHMDGIISKEKLVLSVIKGIFNIAKHNDDAPAGMEICEVLINSYKNWQRKPNPNKEVREAVDSGFNLAIKLSIFPYLSIMQDLANQLLNLRWNERVAINRAAYQELEKPVTYLLPYITDPDIKSDAEKMMKIIRRSL